MQTVVNSSAEVARVRSPVTQEVIGVSALCGHTLIRAPVLSKSAALDTPLVEVHTLDVVLPPPRETRYVQRPDKLSLRQHTNVHVVREWIWTRGKASDAILPIRVVLDVLGCRDIQELLAFVHVSRFSVLEEQPRGAFALRELLRRCQPCYSLRLPSKVLLTLTHRPLVVGVSSLEVHLLLYRPVLGDLITLDAEHVNTSHQCPCGLDARVRPHFIPLGNHPNELRALAPDAILGLRVVGNALQ